MKKLCILILPAIALALGYCSFAEQKEQPLPRDLPAYGPTVPFHAPQVDTKKISNGMTLWMVSRPGFPKVALAFAVRGGMASDPSELPGLSQLLLATVDQGTKTRSARQIAEAIQAAGGDLSGEARADMLIIGTEVLAEDASKALALIADVFQNATFPSGEVALAKRNAADSLRGEEANPEFLAGRLLAKEVFGSHPYSIISPTQDSISNTQADELRKIYHRRFRPDQTLLVAVGDFQEGAFTAEVEKQFGPWKPPEGPPAPAVAKPSGQNPHAIYVLDRPGSVQTTFAIGAFGPVRRDPDYPASEVANAIYGGMFGSRLVNNIREDKGYTYSPRTFIQTQNQAGVVQTQADVRNAVTGATLNEIDYELNRMATTAPTNDEVERARRFLVGLQAIRLQSQASVARQLATLWCFGLPPEELGLESERIQKVTAEDVAAAGKKYFPASRQTIVAVGEQKVIEDQLAPFGLAFHNISR